MENLSNFGYNFQVKVIAALLKDRAFLNEIYDLLIPEYFDADSLQFLVKSIFSYFNEYKKVPTLEVFKVQINNNLKVEIKQTEAISALKSVWTSLDSDDLDFVKKEIIQFCKNQELKSAILKCVDLLEVKDYDAIKSEIDRATKAVNTTKDFGHNFINDIENRYSEEEKLHHITTGWQVLDELTDGGLPKGKMGVVIAPTGIGKTWVLCAIGAAALKAGKTVLHYTLELDEHYVAKRYDSIISGIPMDDLMYKVDDLKQKIHSRVKGKLYIKYFNPKTVSKNGISTHIDKYIMGDIVPDVVILDYAELLKVSFNKTTRDDLVWGDLYTELRGMAGEKNVALWTADQTNRGGSESDVVDGNKISNSFAKLFALDFVMTVSRRPKDKINNTARFFISKNRFGPDGITLPAIFNTDQAKIEILAPKTDKGQEVKRMMISDSVHEKNEMSEMFDNAFKNRVNSYREEPKNLF